MLINAKMINSTLNNFQHINLKKNNEHTSRVEEKEENKKDKQKGQRGRRQSINVAYTKDLRNI